MPRAAARVAAARKRAGLRGCLDDHCDRLRIGIVDKIVHVILDAARRLVAGGYGIGEAEAAARERHGEHRGHCPGLRDKANSATRAQKVARQLDEGQRNAVDEIDEAEAIRPFDRHVAFRRDPRQFPLLGEPFGPRSRRTLRKK